MNRFEYLPWDEVSEAKSATAKTYFTTVEQWLATALCDGRSKALVMTKLEEAFMWVGKAIRDDQAKRQTGI